MPAPAGPLDEAWRAEVLDRFHDAHEKLYGYGYRDDPRHGVEWVNLRVSGIGPITRPAIARRPHGTATPSPSPSRPAASSTTSGAATRRSTAAAASAPETPLHGPGGDRGVRLDAAGPPRLHGDAWTSYGNPWW